MSILKLTSDTLVGTPATGNIEYNGQFFGTDSNNSRAQMQRFVQETAKTASGTSVDFTGIPSWVKKITVTFSGVSTSGTSNILIQIGSGSVTTSGYASGAAQISNAVVNSTAGFIQTYSVAAVNQYAASCFILNTGTNSYLATGSICTSNNANNGMFSNGYVTLSGALDRVRITTVNGTDTFDAGTINILYEG